MVLANNIFKFRGNNINVIGLEGRVDGDNGQKANTSIGTFFG